MHLNTLWQDSKQKIKVKKAKHSRRLFPQGCCWWMARRGLGSSRQEWWLGRLRGGPCRLAPWAKGLQNRQKNYWDDAILCNLAEMCYPIESVWTSRLFKTISSHSVGSNILPHIAWLTPGWQCKKVQIELHTAAKTAVILNLFTNLMKDKEKDTLFSTFNIHLLSSFLLHPSTPVLGAE